MKIGIVGKGNVGTSLGSGLARTGHEVRYGHRDPKEPVAGAARWGDVVLLAVPFATVRDAAREIGSLADGKVLVDVTNPLDAQMGLALGFTTSAAEEIQKLLPKARVVKAFNTVFAANQGSGRIGTEQLTAFIAGDDRGAKETVIRLARDLGFEPVDAGGLKTARHLEPMAAMLIGLGYGMKMGTGIGYRLAKKQE
ncbi:MAG TPA: NADPH-dependent F420 reductase [Methanoregula sp.]|nr:NADPH-dependent F420 reductase [Methanoregula sp.]